MAVSRMTEFFSTAAFCLSLTLAAYSFGSFLQRKTKLVILNPILVGAVIVIVVLSLLDLPCKIYLEGCKALQFWLTPATVCLSIAFYQQFQALKKHLWAICAGVLAGSVCSLCFIYVMSKFFGLDQAVLISLLPKSITTAMGTVLATQNEGIESLTTAVIMVTGIMGALIGPVLCKLFRITNPIARGVAYGTASHVVGTSKATEIDPISGAVSTLCLVSAGIITAVIFPLVCMLYPLK